MCLFYATEKENIEEKQTKLGSVDIVSASIMAKVLEEREKERAQAKHCESCTCPTPGETILKCLALPYKG